jgi:hypothetical protein
MERCSWWGNVFGLDVDGIAPQSLLSAARLNMDQIAEGDTPRCYQFRKSSRSSSCSLYSACLCRAFPLSY